jgi:hypothetical protein
MERSQVSWRLASWRVADALAQGVVDAAVEVFPHGDSPRSASTAGPGAGRRARRAATSSLQRATAQHQVEAARDALVQHRAVGWFQRERQQLERQRLGGFCASRPTSAARSASDFQCALDALAVGRPPSARP